MNRIAPSRWLLAWISGLVPALACAGPAIEEVITPAQYFQCQIAAREASIQGMQERAAQVSKPGATEADKRNAGEMARHRVTLALYACGKHNAGTLGAYAHRNAEELQAWLNANPQVKARLDEQARRVAALAAQMPAVSPSAKR